MHKWTRLSTEPGPLAANRGRKSSDLKVRSARAIEALTAAGYTGELTNLAGGMKAWTEST